MKNDGRPSDLATEEEGTVTFLPHALSHGKTTPSRTCSTNPYQFWGWRRRFVHEWLSKRRFKFFMLSIVCTNVVLVVMQTDAEANDEEFGIGLSALNHIFLLTYIIEIIAELYVYRADFFYDCSKIFDLSIVMADVVTELFGSLGVRFSVFRLVRLISLARALRTTPAFRELYVMIQGFIGTAKAIVWSTVLLAFILTLFSILTVQMIHPLNLELAEAGIYDGCDRCSRAYSTVMQANLTFFQSIVAGDSWGLVTIPIIERWPWTLLIFIPAVLVLQLGLMNLVMKVIVDSASSHRDAESEMNVVEQQEELKRLRERLYCMCRDMDSDKSGELSVEELVAGYTSNRAFRNTLNAMAFYREDLEAVFSIIDQDDSGTVSYTEFVEAVFKMKTEDSHTMLVFIKSYVCDLRRKIHQELFKTQALIQDWNKPDDTSAGACNDHLGRNQNNSMPAKSLVLSGAADASTPDVASRTPPTLGTAEILDSSSEKVLPGTTITDHARANLSDYGRVPVHGHFSQGLADLRADILQRLDEQATLLSQCIATTSSKTPFNGAPLSSSSMPLCAQGKHLQESGLRSSARSHATVKHKQRYDGFCCNSDRIELKVAGRASGKSGTPVPLMPPVDNLPAW